MPVTPEPLPELEPSDPERTAALHRRKQILAVAAIALASLVPIAMAFGFDVCAPLGAVGVHLDACEPDELAPVPSQPAPSDSPPPAPSTQPTPSPLQPSDDAGVQ